MTIASNKALLPFNTFGLEASARHFAVVSNRSDLVAALRSGIRPVRILGGGSNILFTRDVEGLLLKNEIKGMDLVRAWHNAVHVKVGGGEKWHDFVLWTIQQGLGGLENLSLIPGTAGAAPVQNIGAYGVEIKDVMVRLYATDLETGKERVFTRKECQFGYRDSIFKQSAKGRYCITSVVFSLTRHRHRLHTDYGDIQKKLAENGVQIPTPADISRAVIAIRTAKLPDPALIGNCGSFFKNPEVEAPVFQRLRQQYPDAPGYPLPDQKVKVPAGWLIERAGWKGKRVGNTGAYEKQALVLVNHGGATGNEVRQLAADIIASVEQLSGIRIEPEVNIW